MEENRRITANHIYYPGQHVIKNEIVIHEDCTMLKPKNNNHSPSRAHTPPILITLVMLSTLAASAFVVLLSLCTYYPLDSSLIFDTTEITTTHNILGSFGAQCAALLFYFFGSSAFLLPCILLYFLTVLTTHLIAPAKDKSAVESFGKKNMDRLIAVTILIPLMTVIAHVYDFECISALYPGGFLRVVLLHDACIVRGLNHTFRFFYLCSCG